MHVMIMGALWNPSEHSRVFELASIVGCWRSKWLIVKAHIYKNGKGFYQYFGPAGRRTSLL